ncbi:hypothetical protein MRX96_026040 [Rhipicephalus microplus]
MGDSEDALEPAVLTAAAERAGKWPGRCPAAAGLLPSDGLAGHRPETALLLLRDQETAPLGGQAAAGDRGLSTGGGCGRPFGRGPALTGATSAGPTAVVGCWPGASRQPPGRQTEAEIEVCGFFSIFFSF